MLALAIKAQGDPVAPNAEMIELPEPEPGPGELRVRTEASAFNHLDLWVGRGLPGIDTQYPHVSGSDGCGVVDKVGDGVDEHLMGRRVVVNAAMEQPQKGKVAGRDIVMLGEHTQGTHAQAFLSPASNVVDVGDVDPIKAAAFGLSHLTAWRMMVTRGCLQRGDLVLITGIGGGTALAALNIAEHFDCTSIVTSRHQWKLDKAVAIGADHGVLDTGEGFSRSVRGLTDKRGVDVCVDSIGGPVHHECIKSLARGGRLVICGCTAGARPATDLARLFWNQQSILGSTMGDMSEFREALALLTDGSRGPVIDAVHPARDGAAALERLESGEQFGKLVLDWRTA
ncbi:MAG: zinc-binding dehydrogenase [Phycisphaerales bacterium]|nr:zinc-binding dehydrogenase [Phycisphaerales bacterium]